MQLASEELKEAQAELEVLRRAKESAEGKAASAEKKLAAATRQREQAVPTPGPTITGPTITPVDGMMELPLPTSLPPSSHYIGDRSSRNAPAVDTTRARVPKRPNTGGSEQPSRVRAKTTRGDYGPRNTVGDGRPVEPRAVATKRPTTAPSTQPDRRRPRTASVVESRVSNIEQRIQTVPVRRRPNQT